MAPNFSSGGKAFFTLTLIFLVICGIFIGLRFVAMRISRRKFALDDGFILVAYANTVALGGVGMWSSVNGLGKSAAVLTEYEIAAAAKLLFTAYICWLLASVFYKLAILALYNRIFTTAKFRKWSYGVMALVICYCVSFFCVYMTNCVPIDYMWNPTPGGYCRDGQVSDYSTLAINMFLDLAILVLPMPTLWNLKLPAKKKAVVTIMFSFGLLTIAFMIWRIIWTQQYRANPDFTSYLELIAIVSGFELWTGIIVANIPTLAPLSKAGRFPRSRASSHPKKSYGSSFSSKRLGPPIPLHVLQSSKQTDSVRKYGSQDHFLESQIYEEVSIPRVHHVVGPSFIMTECAYDPTGPQRSPPLAADAIYVRMSIEDGMDR